MACLEWIIFVLTVIGAIYLWGTRERNYFKRRGIKNVDIGFPIIGALINLIKAKRHLTEFMTAIYNEFPDERYIGHFEFTSKMIMLKDLDLIKQVAIKDFDHFTDHRQFIDEDADPLLGRTLFTLRGSRWKDMRSTLSPAFTSAKMRNMFGFIVDCSEQIVRYHKNKIGESNVELDVELRDLFTRYANDVIATSAFGVLVDSLEHRDNEFYTMAKKSSTFDFDRILKIIGYRLMPGLFKKFKISLTPKSVERFFRSLIEDTMYSRDRDGIVRQDMIHLLMEAKKGVLKHETSAPELDAGFASVEESSVGRQTVKTKWTDDELTAQAMIFLLAGFDTVSTLMSFTLYELAINPDVQIKLQNEIDEYEANINRKLTYNDLNHLKYLDMVISETLRMWPPAVTTDRVCVKPYTLPPPNDTSQPYRMDIGDAMWIPIRGIQHDPKYYPNPDKFNPERFSDENKAKIPQFAFIPFGIGPRNCIGSRFALMEAKAIVYYLLLNFDVVRTAKTEVPLIMKKRTVTMVPENGFWVGFKPRIKEIKVKTTPKVPLTIFGRIAQLNN